jgi:glycosyltransferase involved in cell wall biosynthesis
MRNILLLTNIPAPYRIPTFNSLARLVGERFCVVFHTLAEARRCWDFPDGNIEFKWRVLSDSGSVTGLRKELTAGIKMLTYVSSEQPSAIICGGYDSLASWAAFLWCKVCRRPFVLWVDSTARDQRPRGLSGRMRTQLKRLIVSLSDAVAPSGTACAEYMRRLGARPERIFMARLSGDPGAFAGEAAPVDVRREKVPRRLPGRLILYSGRLVRAKGVFVLLEAFRQVCRVLSETGLLVVGHGPDEAEIRDFCRKESIERVFLEGAQQYRRMPYYYALADVLALPTFSDTWGFVVNEAFACGVPAVVSRAAGACDDLIVDGETGFAVEPGNARDLADKLIRILSDPSLKTRMGAKCRKLIQHYSAEACACGLLAAVESRQTLRDPFYLPLLHDNRC